MSMQYRYYINVWTTSLRNCNSDWALTAFLPSSFRSCFVNSRSNRFWIRRQRLIQLCTLIGSSLTRRTETSRGRHAGRIPDIAAGAGGGGGGGEWFFDLRFASWLIPRLWLGGSGRENSVDPGKREEKGRKGKRKNTTEWMFLRGEDTNEWEEDKWTYERFPEITYGPSVFLLLSATSLLVRTLLSIPLLSHHHRPTNRQDRIPRGRSATPRRSRRFYPMV